MTIPGHNTGIYIEIFELGYFTGTIVTNWLFFSFSFLNDCGVTCCASMCLLLCYHVTASLKKQIPPRTQSAPNE